MNRAAAVLAALAVVAAAGRTRATATLDESNGIYADDFCDFAGLSFEQNVRVAGQSVPPPADQPKNEALRCGVRLALSDWSFTQCCTRDVDSISVPFDAPGAALGDTAALTSPGAGCTVLNDTAVKAGQTLTLWQHVYQAGADLTLNPAITVTLMNQNNVWVARPEAHADHVEAITSSTNPYLVRGPFARDLTPGKAYTVTFSSAFCETLNCLGPITTQGAELGVYDVVYGGTELAPPVHVMMGSYSAAPAGSFFNMGVSSPITLEVPVPKLLPAGNGFEYRIRMTFTEDGTPASPLCSPLCSASVWVDTVTVMAQGRPLTPQGFSVAPCPAGQKPCRTGCIDNALPCGWDAASVYVDTGSYVSPVFDSLSDRTIWDTLWWSVDQNIANNWPQTPVAIKWRVGNTLTPGIWLNHPWEFNWTVDMSTTCYNEYADDGTSNSNCHPDLLGHTTTCDPSTLPVSGRDVTVWPCPPPYPPPLPNTGSVPVTWTGGGTLVGRYFQYEVDFTSNFANGILPPEAAANGIRYENWALTPALKGLRVYYQPQRGMVVSAAVSPQQIVGWKSVSYATDLSSGGSIQVDVLDGNGVPLFTNVPSGFSLAGLDIGRYPRLKLRAFVDNEGDAKARPVLKTWSLNWQSASDPLQVGCNTVSLATGEPCQIVVVLTAARTATVTVHDAAGQLVRRFWDGTLQAGLSRWAWDGRNDHGQLVAPGVYFVSLLAREIRGIKRVAVVR